MTGKKLIYLLAGGRPANPRANDLLIREALRASGRTAPSVGYVGTANADDEGFFTRMAGRLRENGAGAVKQAVLAPDNADISTAKKILAHADIICMAGGDVDKGMQPLKEKHMANFLVELYQDGTPFFGLSAGSILLAQEWVRWLDPDDDTTAEVFPCLGLAPVICDTHDEEGGWEELKALLLLEKDGATGYGIAAGTALRVSPDGGMEALGGAVHRFVNRGGNVMRISDVVPL